ncbi:MAG: extracellular solute-binding protein [Solirubrobacteraceae bacterium]
MRTKRRLGAMCIAGALALGGLSACGSSGSSGGQAAKAPSAKGSVRGQTINVAIAYPAPKAMLAKFTAQTGVKVNWEYLQWDDLQTKIASAAQAQSYFADVADVDWSKVGEYYQTKWFIPLNSYFNPSQIQSQYPQLASFIRKGQLIGMPMDGSLLVTTFNKKDAQAAGVTTTPKTFSQYAADLKTIGAKGVVPNPLDIPFAAAEGLSTYWYELTAAYGGQVLSASYAPQFTSPSSPGYKALAWMVSAYKSGLVPKANLNEQDYQALEADQAHNRTASVFSDYSGTLGTIYDVPSQSKVVGQVEYIPTPGLSGPAPNLGNPDGIGIPAQAKHVAAAVAFIRWMEQPANQAAFAGAQGVKNEISTFPLPSNRGGLSALVASHKVAGAATLAGLLEQHARAIFPAGAPPWYGQFSNAVYTNIHSAAAGTESVAGAISAIDSTVKSLGSS